VIFMTGFADVPTSVRAMKAGAVDFLEKPVQRQDLLDAIGRALVRDERQRRERDETGAACAALRAADPPGTGSAGAGRRGQAQQADRHRLQVSERTIKTLRAQGMDKLGATSPPSWASLIRAAAPRAEG
jgi:FixJ family two-component response regulator